jgi:hypothetical protein
LEDYGSFASEWFGAYFWRANGKQPSRTDQFESAPAI